MPIANVDFSRFNAGDYPMQAALLNSKLKQDAYQNFGDRLGAGVTQGFDTQNRNFNLQEELAARKAAIDQEMNQRMAEMKSHENIAAGQLGLGRDTLAQSGLQFDKNYGLNERQFDQRKIQDTIDNFLKAGDLDQRSEVLKHNVFNDNRQFNLERQKFDFATNPTDLGLERKLKQSQIAATDASAGSKKDQNDIRDDGIAQAVNTENMYGREGLFGNNADVAKKHNTIKANTTFRNFLSQNANTGVGAPELIAFFNMPENKGIYEYLTGPVKQLANNISSGDVKFTKNGLQYASLFAPNELPPSPQINIPQMPSSNKVGFGDAISKYPSVVNDLLNFQFGPVADDVDFLFRGNRR